MVDLAAGLEIRIFVDEKRITGAPGLHGGDNPSLQIATACPDRSGSGRQAKQRWNAPAGSATTISARTATSVKTLISVSFKSNFLTCDTVV